MGGCPRFWFGFSTEPNANSFNEFAWTAIRPIQSGDAREARVLFTLSRRSAPPLVLVHVRHFHSLTEDASFQIDCRRAVILSHLKASHEIGVDALDDFGHHLGGAVGHFGVAVHGVVEVVLVRGHFIQLLLGDGQAVLQRARYNLLARC